MHELTSGANATTSGLRKLTPWLPACLLFGGTMFWITQDGAYFSTTWYPSALCALSLLVVTVATAGRLLPASRAARIALLSFAGLVALNYLSILWSASRGDALTASDQLLLYLAAAWVLSLLPWTAAAFAVLLGMWSVGVAAICGIDLIRATSTTDLSHFFDQLRYATPLGYPNATAALAVMGMWPALVLSANRGVPAWIRPLLLAVGLFLAEFALLPQSRGAIVGAAVTAPLALLLCSNRLVLITRLGVVAAGIAFTGPAVVHAGNVVGAGEVVGPLLDVAAKKLVLSVAAALVVGGLLCLIDPVTWRLESAGSRGVRRVVGRRVRFTVVALTAVVVVGGVVAAGPIAHVAHSVYRQGQTDASAGSSRLLSLTPEERFDTARVAWDLFLHNPLGGVGAGNYGVHYDALRRFPKHSMYVHNLELRTLAETGIVGFLLFIGLLGALGVGLVRAAFRRQALGRGCAVAALLVSTYFLVHASFDWMDEFPALAVPALGFALAALCVAEPASDRDPSPTLGRVARFRPSPRIKFGVTAALLTLELLGALALTAPWLSTLYVNLATKAAGTAPALADRYLSRAATLNPWSTDPWIARATIAIAYHEPRAARTAFARSLQVDDAWYPRLELALLAAQSGDFAQARTQLAIVKQLSVDDPVVMQAEMLIRQRDRIDVERFNSLLEQGVNAPLFAPQNLH